MWRTRDSSLLGLLNLGTGFGFGGFCSLHCLHRMYFESSFLESQTANAVKMITIIGPTRIVTISVIFTYGYWLLSNALTVSPRPGCGCGSPPVWLLIPKVPLPTPNALVICNFCHPHSGIMPFPVVL